MSGPLSKTVGAIASLALSLAFATTAHAQIDKRVNTGNANSGRVHDANPGVGSGGVNLARPAFDLGGRADAIITGNVSGLGSFQGGSPLLQNNAFRASLGSTSLSSFQRQSVGISDVLANQTYTPGYFYDTQRTIADINDIRRGWNQPGSSTLRSPALPPVRAGGVGESRLDLGLREREDRRIGIPGTTELPSQRTIGDPRPLSIAPLYFDQAAASSIFGPPAARPGILEQMAERRAARRELIERVANDLQRSRLEDELKLRDTGYAAPQPQPAAAQETMPPSIASIRVTGDETPVPSAGPGFFQEMTEALRAAQASGQPLLGFKARASDENAQGPKEAAPDAPDDAADSPTRVDIKRARGRRAEGLTDKPSDAAISAATAAKWAGVNLNDPIASFAGVNADRFTGYMVDGEEALRAGRYSDAARYFELAEVIDRRNPLPLLARGHALAAGGYYVSAVHSLTRGIALFPQIAAFKLDLPAMVGQSDVFDRRRADLERRLTYREDRELRFLLGYLELYSGLTDAAQKNLTLAAKGAREGSAIARFPDLIFGAERIPIVQP